MNAQTRVIESEIKPCEIESDDWDLQYRWDFLESFEQVNDTVFLTIGSPENCAFGNTYNGNVCDTFKARVEAGVLYLNVAHFRGGLDENGVMHEACPSANCGCYFKISIKLLTGREKIEKVYYAGNDITQRRSIYKIVGKPTFEIYKGDTINYTDRYGIKHGSWIDFREDGSIRKEVIVFEDKGYGLEIMDSGDSTGRAELLWLKGVPLRLTNYGLDGRIQNERYIAGKKYESIEFVRSQKGILKEIHFVKKGDREARIIK